MVRIDSPDYIPVELIDQIKDRYYETDSWYKYLRVICMKLTPEGLAYNPFCYLYAVADGDTVVGVLWYELSLLDVAIRIQTFSMHRDFWGRGQAVKLLSDFIQEQMKKAGVKKCYWSTKYPKHSEKYGFKRSRNVLMEFKFEIDNNAEL